MKKNFIFRITISFSIFTLLILFLVNYEAFSKENNSSMDYNIKLSSSQHSLAIVNQQLWKWGWNKYNQVSHSNNKNYFLPLIEENNFTHLTTGYSHSAAIDTQGNIVLWGANDHHQLSNTNSSENILKHKSTYISVSAGKYHNIALRGDSKVETWGNNYWGQLGTGSVNLKYDQTTNNKPTEINLDKVIQISAGGNYSAALKEDGSVWGWGRNNDERTQAGLLPKDTDSDLLKHSTPRKIKNLEEVIFISVSSQNNLAVKSDGTVWNWRHDQDAKLVKGLKDIVRVSAGEGHFLALDKYGIVWSWGKNFYGQLGNDSLEDQLTPLKVPNLKSIVEISAGDGFSLVIDEKGRLYSWGGNKLGELGSNPLVEILKHPTQIPAPSTILINNELKKYSFPPFVINGTTLVPLRGIFEDLNATVSWNNLSKTVTAQKNLITLSLTVGEKKVIINNQEIELIQPAIIIQGNVMVPLRVVSEALGAKVSWLPKERVVEINYE